jgi:hypothetical protein
MHNNLYEYTRINNVVKKKDVFLLLGTILGLVFLFAFFLLVV